MDTRDQQRSARLAGVIQLLADMGEPNVDAAALLHALQQAGWTPPDGHLGGLRAEAKKTPPMNAIDYLQAAAFEMDSRAKQRDTPEGERSMAGAVRAFNALYHGQIEHRLMSGLPPLSETHGWELQSLLKKSRAAQGAYHADDYVDDVGYVALAAECAAREQAENPA
ncbi:hypothetical protein J2T57_002638 [Natronocella acetinitrilica]|uniref:DUF6378 domain-containing protein n=1 Tax=Natronocella acetinitrilica TaxID=414046 RepID=A0AAE3G5H1_9GAMM|nr:DUF6378 domain-containing protein [Natronocella acetinitrilica]MCP1675488.1 hypothetical protein [Natronocella acetinitrilica]